MSRHPRVVATGLGAVSPWGWDVAHLRAGLASGGSAISEPQRLDTTTQRTRLAGEVPGLAPGELRLEPSTTRADAFAVAAASAACRDAGLAPAGAAVGVYFGGSTAGMAETEEFVACLLGVREGRPRLAQVAAQTVNAPGDAVARRLGVCGPVVTVSSACASGGLALGLAFEALLAGEVEIALAGGADALCRLTYAGFNSLRSVDSAPCRPFRPDREGLSLGEGAGVLVLETLEHARARGAPPLAELAGCGSSCDAHHMTAPDPEGRGAAAAIRAALAAAGLESGDVSFVNAHGTGTPHNDSSETRAILEVFGERGRTIPVTSTKGSIGHLLGSSGAVEAVATVLALLDGAVQPTPGADPVDAELGIDLVLNAPRPLPPNAVGVSTSLAFGGANAAVVLAAASRLEAGQ